MPCYGFSYRSTSITAIWLFLWCLVEKNICGFRQVTRAVEATFVKVIPELLRDLIWGQPKKYLLFSAGDSRRKRQAKLISFLILLFMDVPSVVAC